MSQNQPQPPTPAPNPVAWIDPNMAYSNAYDAEQHKQWNSPGADAAVATAKKISSNWDPDDEEDIRGNYCEPFAEKAGEAAEKAAIAANAASGAQPTAQQMPGAPAPPPDPGMTQAEIDALKAEAQSEVFNTKLRRKSTKDVGGWIGTDDGLYDEDQVHQGEDPNKPTEHSLNVDLWNQRMGRWLHGEEWNRNPDFVPGSDEFAKREFLYDQTTLADVHTACFEPIPTLSKNPENKIAAEWFKTLLETDDFQGLRNSTVLDTTMAEIGTAQISSQWTQYYMSLSDEEKQQIQGGQNNIRTDMKRLGSCQKAAQSAKQDVGDAMGAGRGMGMLDGQRVDSKKLMDAFKKVRDNESLRRMMNMAGKMRRAAASLQRRKSIHARDEVVGVTTGGDLDLVVPTELADLVDPDLELDFYRRLMEESLMIWDESGTEPVAKGPIIVGVDESGSMSGEPHDHAKALALALGWVAMHQKRWIGFIGFSGGHECTACAFAPGQWDQDQLIGWLTHFYGGGTTLEAMCETLPNQLWDQWGVPNGKTDIVIITDDDVYCHEPMRSNFLAWKAEKKAKVYGLALGGAKSEGLKHIADRVWAISNLEVDTDPVQEMLAM